MARKSRIPKFKNYEEEAAFWDSHSLAEFEDELTVVKNIKVTRPLQHVLMVPLTARTIDELARHARSLGVSLTALAGSWIEQRLAEELAGPNRPQESAPEPAAPTRG